MRVWRYQRTDEKSEFEVLADDGFKIPGITWVLATTDNLGSEQQARMDQAPANPVADNARPPPRARPTPITRYGAEASIPPSDPERHLQSGSASTGHHRGVASLDAGRDRADSEPAIAHICRINSEPGARAPGGGPWDGTLDRGRLSSQGVAWRGVERKMPVEHSSAVARVVRVVGRDGRVGGSVHLR